MLFSILIPTLNRPKNIDHVLKTLYETANKKSEIEVIFYTDKDDVYSQKHIESKNDKNIKWTTSENKILFSDMWNYAYKVSTGKYLMLCGDDVEFKTKDWDLKVEQHFKNTVDEIAYVVPQDGFHNGKLGIHGFISRKWAELVGFFTPPYFAYWYADTWLDDVSRRIDRFIYDHSIEIMHLHPADAAPNNKRSIDAVYLSNRNKINESLHQLFRDKQSERNEQAKILFKHIQDYKNIQIQKKLSVLICSIDRRRPLLNKLLDNLNNQINKFNLQNDVEILTDIDNEIKSIGQKRNDLIQKATGEYTVFIDDDDSVSENYLKSIVEAAKEKPDCIGFRGYVTYKDGRVYKFHNSTKNLKNIWNHATLEVVDDISHFNPIASRISKNVLFPDAFWGEDVAWLKKVREFCVKEYFIDEYLYTFSPSGEDVTKRKKDQQKNV